MDPTRIAEIRERLAKRTQGEWCMVNPDALTPAEVCSGAVSPIYIAMMRQSHISDCGLANAQFIAHTPADIRDLLEERERLLELVAHATLAICKVGCADDCIEIELCLHERAALKGGN